MYRRIDVAIDESEPASAALDAALRLAGEQQARLRAVYVVDLEPLLATGAEGINLDAVETAWCAAGHRILERASSLAAAAGVDIETKLLETPKDGVDISDAIVADATSWKADVVVIGTHGRRGLARQLLGSVAEAVARTATMPVLLIRGPAASA
ncbi:MAG TPA: universal stress protein [Thermomicrobiaceae bacterium]|nr:universal stress protein [Thermomicrobiaceae bacterium]